MHWRTVLRTSICLLSLTVYAAGQTEGEGSAVDPNAAPAEPPPADAGPPEGGVPPEGAAPPDGAPPAPAEGDPDVEPLLGPPPGTEGDESDEEPELPMTPPATDGLRGHFMLGAAAAYQKPLGKF